MKFLKLVTDIFLWPGDWVRQKVGMSVEEDGGILRSFVNMCVWGSIFTALAMQYFL
ncbi:MAG: hypothetical protein AB8B49_10330 [Nitratireductor sp.]